jgi:hypothetical protein
MSSPFPSGQRTVRARRSAPLAFAVLALALGAQVATAQAAPSAPAGFKVTKVADPPKGAANCDDLAFLAGNLFMGCQNKTLSNGGGGNSTLVEYSLAGKILNTWSIKDKIDGLTGDPLKHFVIATLNEDAATHLVTITPSAPAGKQVTYYNYSPDIRGASTPTALRSGGGTDHVVVDTSGNILTNGSHAGTTTGTAVFRVTLKAPSSPTGTGTATLKPTYLDNASAANGNTGKGTVKLALGDVDSGAIVPKSSPRFGGSYVITDQTALELVFANNIFTGKGPTVLKTAFGLDDLLWTSAPHGTLYVVDIGPAQVLPKVSISALYKVTGPFVTNTVIAANDGLGSELVTVNLNNGKLTPFVTGLQRTKGLVYLNPDNTQTQLPLNGASAAKAAATTATTLESGSSNIALIIASLLVAALAIVGGGGYWYTRRERTSS